MRVKIKSILFLLFILPYAFSEIGGKCSSNANNGVCISETECKQHGDKYVKGLCPNDSNEIRCCLDIYCAYGGKRGKCTWNCKGTAHPGLCPGGNGFVCCI